MLKQRLIEILMAVFVWGWLWGLAPAIGAADEFPAAPFSPQLIYQNWENRALCERLEYAARLDFFQHHPGQLMSDHAIAELKHSQLNIKSVSITPVAGREPQNWRESPLGQVSGRWTSDGDEKLLYAREFGGAHVDRYINFYGLSWDMPGRDLERGHRNSLNLKRVNDGLLHGRARFAVNFLRQLPANAQFIEIDGLTYISVDVGYYDKSDRVILSLDSDLSATVECVIAIESGGRDIKAQYDQLPLVSALKNVARQMIGSRNDCQDGTAHPFAYLDWRQQEFYHDLLFQPWGMYQVSSDWGGSDWQGDLLARVRSDSQYEPDLTSAEGNWRFNSYQYYWSLHSPFNRQIYADFELQSREAIDELAAYYRIDFDIDPEIARDWAGKYVFLIRRRASEAGDNSFWYEYDPDGLFRISEKTATVIDYLDLASRVTDELNIDAPGGEPGSYPAVVYTRALGLAVGAGASVQVLDELIDHGANLAGADLSEPPIINAVDQPQIIKWLLSQKGNVDARNGFGKTALMMAAHMNNLDSVMLLLDGGADVNARTWTKLPQKPRPDWSNDLQPDCRYSQIKYRGRTALMYAAENASKPVIAALLQAGADPSMQDSKGRSVKNYLRRSRKLTDAEKVSVLDLMDKFVVAFK